jgi:4-hydroxyphenylpyruvate dioxygenase-like putative hemolysin
MPILTRVDHLNVQVPPDREEEALEFYRDLVGFKQLQKPDSLGPRGGHFCISENPWYELHVGVARGTSASDIDFKNTLRNHLAFQVEDLADARAKFEARGIKILEAEASYSKSRDFHQDRFFVRDPGGNLLEIMEGRRKYNAVPH